MSNPFVNRQLSDFNAAHYILKVLELWSSVFMFLYFPSEWDVVVSLYKKILEEYEMKVS